MNKEIMSVYMPHTFLLMILVLLPMLSEAQQQTLHDPTLPSGAQQANAESAPDTGGFRPRQIFIINGRHYVVVDGKKLRVGDHLGEERIQRITESEVWLRKGEITRKIPLYEGIEKRNIEKNGVRKKVIKQDAVMAPNTIQILKDRK